MSFFKRPRDVGSADDNDDPIDPHLRLRSSRTAASVIAESIRSEQRAERRKSVREKRSIFRKSAKDKRPQAPSDDARPKEIPGQRRNVYVNQLPSALEVDQHGEPIARYKRNKVCTTKYTIITFIPRNLYEQFRRAANLFFLALVVVQLFPVFGASTGASAALPLAFILTVTAIKDGIEDYRRGVLDEEVNTSAITLLGGGWKNVNQPTDPRPWYQRILGINKPGRVTRGVRKLRDKEAGKAESDIKIMLHRATTTNVTDSTVSLAAGGRKLDDIMSIDSHTYPPALFDASMDTIATSSQDTPQPPWETVGPLSRYYDSTHSRSSFGVVDWRKHSSGSARWERTLWKKLEVGDIVLLRDNEQVPADVVVLATSDADGLCYLETKNLDGETNLKPRRAMKATMGISSEEDIERSSFCLDSEPPHANLYLYHGVLRYTDPTTNEHKQAAVTINEMLLRGCALRNTEWVVALVVFTGADTKIMLNGGDTPSKRSKIEKETNFNVIVNFGVLTFMCVFAAILSGVIDADKSTSASFFEAGSDPTKSYVLNAIITLVTCLIVFQNLVPISLYISIEIVKTIQAYFISQDIDMYYEPYDTPCVPKTWNISDDLGQIEYIFSDKTGTLTQNVMEFQKCSINGVAYGEGITEAQRGAATREGRGHELDPKEIEQRLSKLKNVMITVMEQAFKNRYMQRGKLTLISPQLANDMAEREGAQRQRIIAFFRALAICHNVLPDRPDSKDEPWKVAYKAESPDEAALVAAARDVGFPFLARTKDGVEIEVMGQLEKYTLLRVLEFDSTRKRMSVIVRRPDGRVVLYCKGADSVIYARLREDHDSWLKERTTKDMEMFANNGLRTLCIAFREMEEDEFLTWSRVYDAATSALENRDEEIEKASAMVERDLVILGATALEDKLQEGVPEAIEMLHRAGIKLWILTGDKLQTAIEIGYSCNLLKSEMDVMILSADSLQETRSQIEAGLNKIASVLGPPPMGAKKLKNEERGFVAGAQASFGVVIDGDTLTHALTPELKPLFLILATQCETVVCCRVSPAQKALTVKLVKEGKEAMTLSIGDGANDVAMIQEANIGCGLYGLEGSQAAMSADYAFGQFRFLTKLLLVHGRWSYQRVADMHANFFYKNVIWTLAMFWFLPWNLFSATYLYDYSYILLYNLLFTSLPVVILGAFDQDINAKAALAFPQLYVRGIRGLEYTRTKFWLYMTDGLYQSAVIYFIAFCAWWYGSQISSNGLGIESLNEFGTTAAVSGIFAANAYVGLNSYYWTKMTWYGLIKSSVSIVMWIGIYSFFPSSDMMGEVFILFGNLQFWTTVLLSVTVALTPRFLVKYVSTVYFPLDKDIVREMWVKGDLKDQLGIRHRKDSKNRNVEEQPIFREQHARSMSEASQHESYERAASSTPPPDLTPRSTYLGTPPMRGREIPGADNYASNAQYHEDSSPVPVLQLEMPSPELRGIPSPPFSYYAASEIPVASLSEKVRQYTSDIAAMDTPRPSSRTSSQRKSAQSAIPDRTHTPPAILPNPYPSSPRRQRLSPPHMGQSQDLSSPSLLYHDTGGYEMGTVRRISGGKSSRARSPGMSGGEPDTEMSYRSDEFMTAEDVSRASSNSRVKGWRESRDATPRQSRQYGEEEVDGATIVGVREEQG
ncbi:hypothetical protein APHAL10511_000487 [Amanita phalloides]|nr:hypothetical protein APHAL10511_000487 [Amanita phalloides]